MKASFLALLSLACALFLVPAQAQERAGHKAFKGIELYSWQGSNGDWLFALLPGTNRLKTETEVKKRENRISGVKELEKHLLRLAENEEVFWFLRDPKGFAYPGDKMKEEIISSAKNAKVHLNMSPK